MLVVEGGIDRFDGLGTSRRHHVSDEAPWLVELACGLHVVRCAATIVMDGPAEPLPIDQLLVELAREKLSSRISDEGFVRFVGKHSATKLMLKAACRDRPSKPR